MELFKTMNPDDEKKGTPLPFEKLSKTRWLVRGKVLGNILANWHELTAYFLCVESNCDTKPMLHLIADIDKVEEQYRQVLLVDWNEEEVFPNGLPEDTQSFWTGVARYSLSNGDRAFAELAKYCLTCLVLPISNAIVERIFSSVAAVTTKARNRLTSEMLEAITRIRTTLQSKNTCCKEFQPTQDMLERFNAEQMYLSGD